MVFVDTSAWFASVVPDDPDHAAAIKWLRENERLLITTDYVVDEILTLLRARGQNRRAAALGSRLFEGAVADIHYLTQADIAEAWATFVRSADKEWSFTDCSSRVVIASRRIYTAFALDHHFEQFGNVIVVP